MWFLRKKKGKDHVQASPTGSTATLVPRREQEKLEDDSSTLVENPYERTSSPEDVAPIPKKEDKDPLESSSDVYPWSVRRLVMQSPTRSAKLPFPRYGHALSATATRDGDLYLFGGLVGESALHNDVYAITPNDKNISVRKIQTTGDIPKGRTGCGSALQANVLVVWGGDTRADLNAPKLDADDDALYMLNLVSREWTKLDIYGPRPEARYGHITTIVGSKFFIFGGQMDGRFFGDLWSFDLFSLRSAPVWERWFPSASSEAPAARTSHACVTYKDQIIIFGGTDGKYHYNDTWSFDPQTRRWTELKCIGYIPSPREGHAAALVGDVLYVFGGRGIDGRDLGDLVALRLSDHRWCTFSHMGRRPSSRSGHAMASIGTSVFVLGGDSFPPSRSENWSASHVLNTNLIKYPGNVIDK